MSHTGVVRRGDDGDSGAFGVIRECVKDRLDVELLAGGVDVVAAGGDGSADNSSAGRGERSGAVDDRVACAEGCHEGVVVVDVGHLPLDIGDSRTRCGLA